MNIWITYSYQDKQFVDKLKKGLSSKGHTISLVEHSIEIGDSILKTIEDHIMKADAFLLVFSQESEKSKWFTSEIFLIMREVTNRKKEKRLIPIVINKGIRLPPLIDQIAYADFTNQDNFEVSFLKLLSSLEKPKTHGLLETEKTIETLIKEKEKLLQLQKQAYELDNTKQVEMKRLFRFSTIITMIAAVVSSIFLFSEFIFKKNIAADILDSTQIFYYFLGVLTTLIPTMYFTLKNKRTKNGK
jgi:hypothetical protein